MYTVEDMIKLAISLVVAVVVAFLVIRCVKELVNLVRSSGGSKRSSSKKSNYVELQTAARMAAESSVEFVEHRKVNGFSTLLYLELQNRFIPGRDAYETARLNGNRRSVIFSDAAGLQKLLDEKAGTGEFVAANKEKVNFGQTLGQYLDPEANTQLRTTIGIIHYMPEGAYIVPARPATGEVDLNG